MLERNVSFFSCDDTLCKNKLIHLFTCLAPFRAESGNYSVRIPGLCSDRDTWIVLNFSSWYKVLVGVLYNKKKISFAIQ